MNFTKLQEDLHNFELEIFTLNDIAKITGQDKNVLKTRLSTLAKQKKIFRIKRGYYSLKKIQEKFKLQTVFKNSYVGLYSALEYYGSTTQRFTNLDLITANTLNQQIIHETTINFHKVKKNMFFGYKIIDDITISSIEKTIIDCVYFSSKVYLTETLEFIRKNKKQINTALLKDFLEKIDSSALNKRISYLLNKEGINIKNLKMNNKLEKLNVNKESKGEIDNKLKLIINEDF